jgi:hypothetical protein
MDPLIGFGYATLWIAKVNRAQMVPAINAASMPPIVMTDAIAQIPAYSRSIEEQTEKISMWIRS